VIDLALRGDATTSSYEALDKWPLVLVGT
jgi:hypothetical protein